MRPVGVVSLLLLVAVTSSAAALSGQGLVNPQSACNIRCENGGMCAFSFDNPHYHSCICLMGVYEGERCQYEVGVPRMNLQQPPHHAAPPPPAPTPIPEEVSVDTYNMRQREIERQREEQRRRDYELRLEAEHRRRAEEARRVGLTPVAAGNPAEDQRIEELRRRDEELRRIAARRREEERRREQEMQRQHPPPLHHQQQHQHQQHHEHQQRIHEDQRRLEFARQEEQRIRDEQQRLSEKERMETTTGRAEMDVLTSAQGSDGDELDTATPEGVDWEYKSSEVGDQEPPPDYLPNEADLERDDNVMEDNSSMDDHQAIPTTSDAPGAITESASANEDTSVLSQITRAIEDAADKTVKVHGLHLDTNSPNGPEDDDYWDHSIKREDEDYEVPKVADSNEESHLAPATTSPSGVREFAAEEGEEGWMMMRRVDEKLSFSSTASLSLASAAMALIFRIW